MTPPEPAHESDGSGSTDADEVVNLSYRNAQETFTVGDSPKLVVGNTNGKISVDEAEQLLSLVEEPADEPTDPFPPPKQRNDPGKYLRIVGANGDERVNIRVPLSLIRVGVKIGALFTTGPSSKINERLKEKGIDLDQLGGTDGLDDLVNGLSELEIDVQDGTHDRARIYAE